MESLEEKKWEGHGCSKEAEVHTRAKYSHMVWMKTKPEHMVSAEEDTAKGKNTCKRSIKKTEEYKSQWYSHAGEQVENDHKPWNQHVPCLEP